MSYRKPAILRLGLSPGPSFFPSSLARADGGTRPGLQPGRRLPDRGLHFAHAIPGRAGGRQRARAGRRERRMCDRGTGDRSPEARGAGRIME